MRNYTFEKHNGAWYPREHPFNGDVTESGLNSHIYKELSEKLNVKFSEHAYRYNSLTLDERDELGVPCIKFDDEAAFIVLSSDGIEI